MEANSSFAAACEKYPPSNGKPDPGMQKRGAKVADFIVEATAMSRIVDLLGS
jgi:hypothetical protein